MNILTLSIKQIYFDQIRSGLKKDEIREIRPNNAGRYIRYCVDGQRYEREEDIPESAIDVIVEPRKYDAIKFLTGAYSGVRPSMLVEVLDAEVQILTDEEDNDIVYEFEGKEYLAAQIVYQLGKILQISIK